MRKKDYVLQIKNCVLNRVRFHAPVLYDTTLDKRSLFESGVNLDLPVFKFDKKLNKNLTKGFYLAAKEQDFNLLVSSNSFEKEKQLKKLKNCIVYNPQTCRASLLESINKLNINYSSSSNYNLVFKEKYFKVQGKILNPHYEEFSLQQVLIEEDVFVEHFEFVLNGTNFYTKLQNKSSTEKKVAIELNIPLEKGYYFFKRMTKYLVIESLLTQKRQYLNFLCKGAKFCFSEVDGLENSVYSCVNVRVCVTLKPNEEAFVFFNFGDVKMPLKGEKEVLFLKRNSYAKCCEIFNLRVKTKNPKFDIFFNKTLPQKIWINWANGKTDQILEEKYLNLKKLFLRGEENLCLVNFKEIGVKELGIFNGKYYKKILVVRGEDKFLKIGRTFFYNVNSISKQALAKDETLALSFGN